MQLVGAITGQKSRQESQQQELLLEKETRVQVTSKCCNF